jgi:hypothetical protein
MWEQLVWCVRVRVRVCVCVCSKHLTWRVSWSERILHISTCIHLNLLQGSILCIRPISSHTCSHTFYHFVIYCYILLRSCPYQILSEIPRISIMDIPRKDRKVSFFPWVFPWVFPCCHPIFGSLQRSAAPGAASCRQVHMAKAQRGRRMAGPSKRTWNQLTCRDLT